jgi:branched-chain amino acid aminotransferase
LIQGFLMFLGRLSTMRTIPQAFRFSTVAPLDASKLIVTRSTAPFTKQPKEELKFGVAHTDHILEMDWTQEAGYAAPVIKPFGSFNLHPSASSLHYGLECFEGMKAYIDADGKTRLFRPYMNMARFNSSLERLVMPTFDQEEYMKCLIELLRVDKDWIPRGRGFSLYIRPTAISTYGILGVVATQATKNYVVLSPVGPYFPEGFTAVSLLADPQFVRAWPGGTGYIKCGGNYAMGMSATREANAQGCNQVLWLYGDNHQVTEAGTMNVFFLWTRRDGL